MTIEEHRIAFETWITSEPYEKSVARWPSDSACWPGQYTDYVVQLAWETWQEAIALNKEQK